MPESVPPAGEPGLPHPPLTALLDDQVSRWEAGERPRVEDYLSRFPGLARDPEAVLNLVYQEVLLHERAGERPTKEEYVGRFPELADELDVQFAIDGFIQRVAPPVLTRSFCAGSA